MGKQLYTVNLQWYSLPSLNIGGKYRSTLRMDSSPVTACNQAAIGTNHKTFSSHTLLRSFLFSLHVLQSYIYEHIAT